MDAYENSVHETEIADAQGRPWALRFDNAAAIEAELCCREQYGRALDYLTLADGAAGRTLYALTAIAYGAAVSAARRAQRLGGRVPPPRFEAFEQAFTLRALFDAQGAILGGVLAYLPPGKKKEPAPTGEGTVR